jgi:hypothetical protein
MNGAVPLLPLYAFMLWTGMTLPFRDVKYYADCPVFLGWSSKGGKDGLVGMLVTPNASNLR